MVRPDDGDQTLCHGLAGSGIDCMCNLQHSRYLINNDNKVVLVPQRRHSGFLTLEALHAWDDQPGPLTLCDLLLELFGEQTTAFAIDSDAALILLIS